MELREDNMSIDQEPIKEGKVCANGIEFSYLEAGNGPLALCLHGFPDSAWTWRETLFALAKVGYRAIAPWMRGYAPTAIPVDRRYDMEALIGDVIALHDAFGGDDRSILIGHDWGAFAAYGATAVAPERWRRLVTFSMPPLAVAGQVFQSYDQLRLCWHIFFFQSPLAESIVSANDLIFIERLWRDWSPQFEPEEILIHAIIHAKDALRGEGRVSAALGYYRALFSGPPGELSLSPVPTLYFHGARDGAISPNFPEEPEAYMAEGSRRLVLPGVGHFPHLEQPELVIPELLQFIDLRLGGV